MYFASHVIEMPDYSIQQVEQADYQLGRRLGDYQVISQLKNLSSNSAVSDYRPNIP